MYDHLLPLKHLMIKYGAKDLNRINAQQDLLNSKNLGRSVKTNRIFIDKEYSMFYLFLASFTNPVKILTIISILSLIFIYFFNQKNEVSSTYFVFTIFFLLAVTMVEAYEVSKVKLYYRRKEIIHVSSILIANQEYIIERQYLQIGDILILKKGDIVAADSILIQSNNLTVDRSFMAERRVYLSKTHLKASPDFVNSENVILSGDQIISGEAHAIIVRVGKNTEIRNFYSKTIKPKDLQFLLMGEINVIFLVTLMLALFLSVVLVSIGISTGIKFEKAIGLTLSICLTLIPNRIPSIISLMLTSAVYKLDRKGITIRDAGVIEKLGLLTLVCTGKKAYIGHMDTLCTCIYNGYKIIDIELAFADQDKDSLYYLERISNITRIAGKNKHMPIDILGQILLQYFNNSSDIVLNYHNINIEEQRCAVTNENNSKTLYITGSVEYILSICEYIQIGFVVVKLEQDKKIRILNMVNDLKLNYSEFIALASKPYKSDGESSKLKGFSLVCIYFMEKISNHEQSLVTDILKSTQINFSIITSTGKDYVKDLVKIFQEFTPKNITLSNDIYMNDKIASADRYKVESLAWKSDFLKNENFIVYNSNEKMKYQIIKNLQDLNHIVCYIGSGANDCRAMNRADIGVCYKSSSPICKEACNVVINDDQIDDILYCIEESRLFFVNLRKSIRFITSHIIPQSLPFVFYACFGTPIALSPLLLIILNNLIELPVAIALAYEPPEYNLLIQEPANKEDIKTHLSKSNDKDETFVENANTIIDSFNKIKNRGLAYRLRTITFPVLEIGTITSICCMLTFFICLYLDNVPLSKMFFTANKYFSTNSPPLLLKSGIEINSKKQLDILWRGQSAFFISLVICQMTNLIVCRRTKTYFFTNFFNNSAILTYLLFGLILSFSILYVKYFEKILFLRPPNPLIFACPIIFSFLILFIDTYKKFNL